MRSLLSVNRPKLLADENIKLKLVRFLADEGFDIKYEPKGLKNSLLIEAATKEWRVLLTHDKDFLNTDLYDLRSCLGVILIRIHPPELSKMKSSLKALFKELPAEELKGRLLTVTNEGFNFE